MQLTRAVLTGIATWCSERDMETFSGLIEKLGVARLAVVLDVDESHVRTMKARNSVPPEYWGPIIDEARHQRVAGIDWKSLKALRAVRFRTPRMLRGGRARVESRAAPKRRRQCACGKVSAA